MALFYTQVGEKMVNKLLSALTAAAFAGSAQAALVWQPAPPEKAPQAAAGAHAAHGGRGGGMAFVLQGAASSTEAELWLPTRVRRPLEVAKAGRVAVRGTGLNSYHMLFAKRELAGREEVAMRYVFLQGKPSEVSPAELVNAPKAMLDITPAPLTREHQRYLGLKQAHFIVRYNGKPLAQHPVQLRTSNGTEFSANTDERGRVALELPDDFDEVRGGRRNNLPADFTISASLDAYGRTYHTTLSAPYYVSPAHWQSFGGGLLAMFAGVVGGLVVLQRSRGRTGENNAGEA